MTVTINLLANRAIDLVRCGFSVESAIETTLAGERISASERERIVNLVDEHLSHTVGRRRAQSSPRMLTRNDRVRLSGAQQILLLRMPDMPSSGLRVKGSRKRTARSLKELGLAKIVACSQSEAHYYVRTPEGQAEAKALARDLLR